MISNQNKFTGDHLPTPKLRQTSKGRPHEKLGIALLIETTQPEVIITLCEKILTNQDSIDCLFFYGKGVFIANDVTKKILQIKKNIPCYACVKSIETHQITIAPGVEIAGLATFIGHALTAGQVIQCK